MNVPEATQRGGQVFELLSTSIKSASWSEILVSSLPVLVIAFLVTLLVTPLYRRLAISMNIVDAPSESRKIHSKAVPYLGGLAIATGLLVSLILSYPFVDQWPLGYRQVPVMIIVGMIAICFTGLLDDVKECDSWIKVSGMLIAAAGLAVSNVGTRVAAGLLDCLARGAVLRPDGARADGPRRVVDEVGHPDEPGFVPHALGHPREEHRGVGGALGLDGVDDESNLHAFSRSRSAGRRPRAASMRAR